MTTIPYKSISADVELLLDIWEKDGLDVAVKTWKKMSMDEATLKNKNESNFVIAVL